MNWLIGKVLSDYNSEIKQISNVFAISCRVSNLFLIELKFKWQIMVFLACSIVCYLHLERSLSVFDREGGSVIKRLKDSTKSTKSGETDTSSGQTTTTSGQTSTKSVQTSTMSGQMSTTSGKTITTSGKPITTSGQTSTTSG